MTTEILGLPEIAEGQASKHVTHNTALRRLEGVTTRVLSRSTSAQPGNPTAGDTYIVPTGATGAVWAGQDDSVAHFFGGSWKIYAPTEGMSLWVNDEDQLVVWDGSAWIVPFFPAVMSMPVLVKTADYTVVAGDKGKLITVTDTTAARTITLLPAATAGDGFVLGVAIADATNGVTIDGDGAELVDGSASITLQTGGDSVLLACDGTEWRVVASDITPTGAGAGDVTGPASGIDNALARFDGTTGKAIQGSPVTVGDSGEMAGHSQSLELLTADFTLSASQNGKNLDCAKAGAFTVTVPDNATVALPVGYTVAIVQAGAGTVTVSPAAGVTIRSAGGLTDMADQWAAATLYKRATDEWVLIGDLA